jgi:hypothetical protein
MSGTLVRRAACRRPAPPLLPVEGCEELLCISDWTDYLYGELDALHHFELKVPAAVYRAFLLPHFRWVFGEAVPPPPAVAPDPGHLIGLGWHHVVHARSCIERGKPWQAEYWISGIRDQTLALACLRFGEPADALPSGVTGELEDALVRSLAPEELRRALRVAATRFLGKLHATDAGQAQRLEPPIRELVDLPGAQPPDSAHR